MVFLVDLLRWIHLTENLGVNEAASDMLQRLAASENVPLFLVWLYRPVQIVENQSFELDRISPEQQEHEDFLASELGITLQRQRGSHKYGAPRKSLPEGVSPGRSAALYVLWLGLKEVFSLHGLEYELREFDSGRYEPGSYPLDGLSWRHLAVRGEDAHALWGASEPFQAVKTYSDLMAHTKACRDRGERIAWAVNPHFSGLVADRKARLKASGTKAADDVIAQELNIKPQQVRTLLKSANKPPVKRRT